MIRELKYEVTVAVPVYQAERYVERALLSVLNQTFGSLECLIIDDRGTDGSLDIVKRIAGSHPRGEAVRIVCHGKNEGQGTARNTALDEARGRYLFFMDSDDEITPDCIQRLYDKMMMCPVDFVAGSYDRRDSGGRTFAGIVYEERVVTDPDSLLNPLVTPVSILCHTPMWNKLYDLAFLKTNHIRCIPDMTIEDVIFNFRLLQKARSCAFVSAVTLHYYVTPGSSDVTNKKGVTERVAWQYAEIAEVCFEGLDPAKTGYRNLLSYVVGVNFHFVNLMVTDRNFSPRLKKEYSGRLRKRYPVGELIRSPKVFSNLLKYIVLRMPYPLQSWVLNGVKRLKGERAY